VPLTEAVIGWVARRVTQNVRELEGALTRIAAHVKFAGRPADEAMAQEALGDLDRNLVAPVRTEKIITVVCEYFGLEQKELLSSRRDRHISLARSIAIYLVRKLSKLSYPEIGHSLNKKNHSTIIGACRRIEQALARQEKLEWTGVTGDCREDTADLLQRLEEHCRCAR
jgi:chromosomal replication initiator protein